MISASSVFGAMAPARNRIPVPVSRKRRLDRVAGAKLKVDCGADVGRGIDTEGIAGVGDGTAEAVAAGVG